MNTWVFLLLAISSTTSVQSDDYHQSSAASPVVIHKEYSSSSQDQIAGESSPRTIFIYPPSGGSNGESRSGHHEDSKYHRPGILHSRYLASSLEGDPSKTSQLNPLPLQTQERPQGNNDNDSYKESRYHSSSSSSVNNKNPSDIHDQMSSGSAPHAAYVHALQDRGHEKTRYEQRDNLMYHNSRSNPSDHSSFSQHTSDQSFGESSPHVTYVLPPTVHDTRIHENSKDGNQEGLKYPDSNKFSPTPRDQYFEESGPRPHYDHIPRSRSHEETQYGQLRNAEYHNPTINRTVPYYNGSPSYHHDHPLDKETSIAYETQKEDLKYHSPTRNHPAKFHSELSPNSQDPPADRSASHGNFDRPSYDGNYKQIRDDQHEDFKYHSPTSNSLVSFHNDISSNHHNPSSELSTSHDKFLHRPYEENHETNHKNHPSDFNYHNPTSNPSVLLHSGYASNTRVQDSDQIDKKINIFHPPQQERQSKMPYVNQADLKNDGHPSSSSTNQHDESLSKTNDQSSDESFHHTVFIQPPHNKNYWKTHKRRPEDLRYGSSSRTPSTTIHDVHLSNAQINPIQSTHHFNPKLRPPFEENIKISQDFGYQSPTISPPKATYNSYLESPHEGTEIKSNNYQPNLGQIPPYGESYNGIHNKPFEQLRYHDHNAFPQQAQKDTFVEMYPKVQDQVRYYHGDSNSDKYVSEHDELLSGQNQGHASHVHFHGPTVLPQAEHKIHVNNHHSSHPSKNQPFSIDQQPEYHNSRHVPDHSGHSEDHREISGYVPYSGPYTRPQVLHDGLNTQEFASVTVQPFGMAKAQPPRDQQSSSYLNNQYPAGPRKSDSHHVQVLSLAENQHGENVHEHQNTRHNGVSESRYSQLAPPHTLYNDPSLNSQNQLLKPNTNQNAVTPSPQTYAGSTREGNYGGQYSSGQNRITEAHTEIPHQYSYSGPATSFQHRQDNFNTHVPQNSTRNEQFGTMSRFQTNPPYPYGGEYVNHPGSHSSTYHTGNQHESSTPVPLRNSNTVPQDLYERHNSTIFNNVLPLNNPLTHISYPNGGSYSDRYSSESVGHSGPYQNHHVHQVPVSNSQTVHDGYNNTPSEYLNTGQQALNRAGYTDGNDHSYSLGKDTRIQQDYLSQDHMSHQLRQNVPSSNIPVVTPISAEHINHAGNVKSNAGQDSSVHTISNPAVDHLYPGIHHEYALKFSINKPKPIAKALQFIPNLNQSDYFTGTPAPRIYAGHQEGSQHPSGPVRYIDSQFGYAPHMPYHTVPAVKPIVLQSGYQEDTHEISHAKHDHLHVHHSSQSGYQYGIIS